MGSIKWVMMRLDLGLNKKKITKICFLSYLAALKTSRQRNNLLTECQDPMVSGTEPVFHLIL